MTDTLHFALVTGTVVPVDPTVDAPVSDEEWAAHMVAMDEEEFYAADAYAAEDDAHTRWLWATR